MNNIACNELPLLIAKILRLSRTQPGRNVRKKTIFVQPLF